MTPYSDAQIPVFAGPTLYGRMLDKPFVPLPPAAAGDLIRLLHGVPCTVVLVDGLFDERPAVWHKEILVLLAHGFRVVGAGSMGALRAAELRSFGMIGVGDIFSAYAAARITADDEVAVAHATAAHGWKPFTVPQVNVRATLAKAARAGVITVSEACRLRAASAAILFRDRVWTAILDQANFTPQAPFKNWLVSGEVDLKRIDAEKALRLADALRCTPPEPRPMPPITPFLRRLADWAGVKLD